jgi:hypothetical protein
MNFIFGYGSILNDPSRHATAQQAGRTATPAVLVELQDPTLRRCWCYRSHTGWTALGLMRTELSNCSDVSSPILGVIFPVDDDTLARYDIREVGYDRLLVPNENIKIKSEYGDDVVRAKAIEYSEAMLNGARLYVYIQEESRSCLPDKDYPILQSYLDICVRGCIQWGGPELAKEFLLTTHHWSEFWLGIISDM